MGEGHLIARMVEKDTWKPLIFINVMLKPSAGCRKHPLKLLVRGILVTSKTR